MLEAGAEVAGGRFLVERRLGAGGMGVVYAALDRRRGIHVALKTLKQFDPEGLFRLKNEFRALADLVHPNLVTLHDLVTLEGEWAFTMELIDGVDFLRYVRPLPPTEPGDTDEHAPTDPAEEDEEGLPTRRIRPRTASGKPLGEDSGPKPRPRMVGALSLTRLRAALIELVQGVLFLHSKGKLHRDIKPSNILVTAEGRVVLCDFGLVTDFGRPEGLMLGRSDEGVGTPEYMSPEQMEGLPLSEASDWYSVGILLYHCLAGSPPFRGNVKTLARQKRSGTPVAPSAIFATTPTDLETLCLALLHADPASRPSGQEVLRLLGVEASPSVSRAVTPFVGREGALRTLHGAFAEVRRGTPRTVLIHGGSGMGKSALSHRFLEEVRGRGHALVLASRCYERESVPYKGVDGLVDALVVHLLSRPEAEVAALAPADRGPLVRLFPVLRQLPAFAPTDEGVPQVDSLETRRRAFTALRDVCGGLARKAPLVLFVDDLQWGDVDSANLLSYLLQGADAPPALFVGCYRSEEGDESPAVRSLLYAKSGEPIAGVEQVALSPLSGAESRSLVESILGGSSGDVQVLALTQEAAGIPYLLDELVRFQRSHQNEPPSTASARDRLNGVLRSRLDGLPAAARQLVDVVSLGGGPVPRNIASAASGIGELEPGAVALLRAERLIRVRVKGDSEALELYHDRVRETARAALTEPGRKTLHRQLAVAYEAGQGAEWEARFEHWLGAGEAARAAHYAALSSDRAMEAFAFDRAVRLSTSAVELSDPDSPALPGIRGKLADALAATGRGAEAAEAYLAASQGASAEESRRLRRRAADQFLSSGHVPLGLKLLRELLREAGDRLPMTPREGMLSILRDRLTLAFRGIKFRERKTPPPADLLERLDLLKSATGLTFVDPILAMAFHSRRLVLALRTGNRMEVAWGIASEASSITGRGWSHWEKGEALWRTASGLAEGNNDPLMAMQREVARALMHHFRGEWRQAIAGFDRAVEIGKQVRGDTHYMTVSSHLFASLALGHVGEWNELGKRIPGLLQEALEKGDVYLDSSLRGMVGFLHALSTGNPAAARIELREADRRWSNPGFTVQHYHRLIADTKVDLYEGDARAAHQHSRELWAAAKGAYLNVVEPVRIFANHIRGMSCLALARLPGMDRTALLREAESAAAIVAKSRAPWTLGIAPAIRSGIAAAQGNLPRARELIDQSVAAFDASDMTLYAAAARFRRGDLVGGEAGAADRTEATRWMTVHGTREPSRMVAILVPPLLP